MELKSHDLFCGTKQQVSSVNNPRVVNGKQNMLCKVSINEIYCFAGSFEILGIFVQPSSFPKERDLDVTVSFACVRACVCVCSFQLLNHLTDFHETCIKIMKIYSPQSHIY